MLEKELWIGDRVQLRKSNRVGIYEGRHEDGRARIAIEGKIVRTPFANLLKPEEKPRRRIIDLKDLNERKKEVALNDELDLHIERIAPELRFEIPQVILRKQVKTCRSFIESHIKKGSLHCTIIHGKGSGELRKEVALILCTYPEVIHQIVINEGGATHVTFQYS